ncbi:MAG: hypothetical protein ACM3X7_02580 [Solirubrobacterales bacterium]
MTRNSNMIESSNSRNMGENIRTSTSVYSGGKEYYQHLRDMKSENSSESCEYSASFMMF